MRDVEKLPGNSRIAAALLEALAEGGDTAARDRVLGALGADGVRLRRRADWIPARKLEQALRAAPTDTRLARRVGRGLVKPERLGVVLHGAGMATVEKAYRRIRMLLPIEAPGARLEAEGIEEGRASIVFRPDPQHRPARAFCAMRAAMLEALPALYGLLPAKVVESECVHRGDRQCRFDASWRRTKNTGLLTGLALGVVSGASLALALVGWIGASWMGMAVWLALPSALLLGILGAAAGRSVDLARLLDAVARGHLGHLALLDAVDGELAEKMDQLSKLDAGIEAAIAGAEAAVSQGSAGPVDRDLRGRLTGVGRELHAALARLQRSLVRMREWRCDEAQRGLVEEALEASREIHGIGVGLAQVAVEEDAELADPGEELEAGFPADSERVDMAQIVRRSAAWARSGTVPPEIQVSVEIEPAWVRGQPFLLEQVLIQLLSNAASAVAAAPGGGRIEVRLSADPRGIEVSVVDDGEGIDAEILDGLFDPFSGQSPAGTDGGLGLTLCYRILKQHGGELSVQSEPGEGTRVAALLPPCEEPRGDA